MDPSNFTGKRLKLYEHLIDPENRHKSVKDIAEAVGISRKYYYQLMGEEDFNNAIFDTRNRCLARYIARIDKKMAEQAAEGDQKSARLVYEVLGQVGRGGNQTVNIANPVSETPVLELDKMSDDEILVALDQEQKKIDEVRANIEARKKHSIGNIN